MASDNFNNRPSHTSLEKGGLRYEWRQNYLELNRNKMFSQFVCLHLHPSSYITFSSLFSLFKPPFKLCEIWWQTLYIISRSFIRRQIELAAEVRSGQSRWHTQAPVRSVSARGRGLGNSEIKFHDSWALGVFSILDDLFSLVLVWTPELFSSVSCCLIYWPSYTGDHPSGNTRLYRTKEITLEPGKKKGKLFLFGSIIEGHPNIVKVQAYFWS